MAVDKYTAISETNLMCGISEFCAPAKTFNLSPSNDFELGLLNFLSGETECIYEAIVN